MQFLPGSSFHIPQVTNAENSSTPDVAGPLLSLEQLSQTPDNQYKIDQYHTMLEGMIR